MFPIDLALFILGLGTIWSGIKLREEVYRLAALATGLVELLWGLSWASETVQVILALFSLRIYRLSIPLEE
ncbi:MAG: hypothetical protein HC835_16420 [Oscillatoriales cyanobacterium RM2_1_1]|nr:hypothetical protein [Oscillatoriales cyanobacterium SM2_3_0]NJO47072.1 hypothetical protein [Oscillatoriales cyanobacterium RM2_1_1]